MFDELAVRIERHTRSGEPIELLGRLVAAREQHPDRPMLMVRAGGGLMVHLGEGMEAVSEVLVQDLLDWGLVRREYFGQRGSERLVVPADAVTFYGWLLARRGTPIDTVAEEVLRLVD